jgi:hypothetical protein
LIGNDTQGLARRDLRFLFRRPSGPLDATFTTGGSTFDATDIALNIGQTGGDDDSNTVTVKLVGGTPLADLSFDPDLGPNVPPGGAPLIASTTFAISDLSVGLTVEHFNEFAGIPLKRASLYWIDITSTTSGFDDALVTWGLTSDGWASVSPRTTTARTRQTLGSFSIMARRPLQAISRFRWRSAARRSPNPRPGP